MLDYEKHARYYPVLISTLPLSIAVPYLGLQGYSVGWEEFQKIGAIALCYFSSAVLTALISWFLKDVFRWTSKLLVQCPLYGKDGLNFPTTTMLLHQTTDLSNEYKKQITHKVEQCLHLKFLSKSVEQRKPEEARRIIRDAVDQMREMTRTNKLLLSSNVAYGAARNALGGCFWVLIILIAMWFYNAFNWCIGIFIAVEMIQGIYWLLTLHARAKDYAKILFNAFMTTPIEHQTFASVSECEKVHCPLP